MAPVIDMAFLSFGNQRISAHRATCQTAIGVDMALDPIHSFSRENLLDALEEHHRNQRFMVAIERLVRFQNTDQANIKRIPQNGRKAVHAHSATFPIAQASAEHLAGKLRQRMGTFAI